MARELDAILDRGEAEPAQSCKTENGSVSYLEQVIHPIYKTMDEVSGFCGVFFLSLQILSHFTTHFDEVDELKLNGVVFIYHV